MGVITVQLNSGGREWSNSWSTETDGSIVNFAPWHIRDMEGLTRISISHDRFGELLFNLQADTAWEDDVTAYVSMTAPDGQSFSHVSWPKYHGKYERYQIGIERSGEFHGAGASAVSLDSEYRLALPMAILESSERKLLAGSDPSFSTNITVQNGIDDEQQITFSWKWLAKAGVHTEENRRFFMKITESERTALDDWFTMAMPDIPAGPRWTHDIVMTDYDFLSKNGSGWFSDIDEACQLIAPEDRHRMIFCLHGWYDEVGKYCFDKDSGTFKDQWTAFPYINHPEVAALSAKEPYVQGDPGVHNYGFRNLEHYHPVEMSWTEIRRRLEYAKSRGFRTAFYAMTGLQTTGSKEEHASDGSALDLEFPLWVGPELLGHSYILNPLKSEIRDFFKQYISKLLDAIGDLTDALVMDEAYYIPYGTLGPELCPGYADRAQLTLVKELASICHEYRPDLAFLTADNLGFSRLEHRAFPYSLFADGLFTDVMCWPMSWDCFRFPVWRNTAWSCNWAPVSNFNFTRWGVLSHHGNVSLSNGCFGDDLGLADMDETMKQKVMELWNTRIRSDREKEVSIINCTFPNVDF